MLKALRNFLGNLRYWMLYGKELEYRGITVPVSKGLVPRPVADQIRQKSYEVPEIEAALSLVQDNDKVLELGTGLGIVSGIIAKSKTGCVIESYEANPRLIEIISQLHEANEIQNVKVKNAMLEPRPSATERDFFTNRYFPESSIRATKYSTERIKVPVLDINKVIDEFRPDVLICDIEGAEGLVIPGVDFSGVRAVILEFHPGVLASDEVARIYDTLIGFHLYPNIGLTSGTVMPFERFSGAETR